jgi:hypothetical protein
MVMTFVATVIAGASIASALFGGLVSTDLLLGEALSLVLAGVTATAVAGAAALDG